MRMHPRRFGTYNTAARFASAFINAYYKSKRTSNTNNSVDDYSAVITAIIIGFVVLIIMIASAIN